MLCGKLQNSLISYMLLCIVLDSVAQWLERGIHKPKAVGSNPTRVRYFFNQAKDR